MLYPHNKEPLTPELFANPGSEYRAAPFWAWNNKLDRNELQWQIEQLKKMGYGGFHMHVRTGMATEYLSEEYMEIIKSCVNKARQEGMLAWLYDEDRWPSGAAGGIVTRNPEYRQRFLLLTRKPQTVSGELLARFDVKLDASGSLANYRKINQEEAAEGFAVYAYLQTAPDAPWFNNQAYLNTLDPASVREFIKTTYNRYDQTVSQDFGGVVPAIFTDEPQFARKGTLTYAHDENDVTLPWTFDLEETFQAAYRESLMDHLPELLWDLPGGAPSLTRYRYHDHVAQRFTTAFADQCGQWCGEHGIMLTGHMMQEPSLDSQTGSLGEAMRSYRAFQLPGIDMLCDWREYTTAKQAQSASHQYGRPGVLSELYGVTNWNFDFRGHKLQGDWQAALGVTVRVPHLSWVSMNGEAKRDYPGTFNYQAPWHKEYPYVEDHFARVNTAMTRGKPVVRVGMVHPIESYWLHWGARENTQAIRDQLDRQFQDLTEWMLMGLMDFDFICESLLPEQCAVEQIMDASFPVGDMGYDVIVVPAVETIRATTLERLEKFKAQGGRVITLGGAPALVDACPNTRPQGLWAQCEQIACDRIALLNALGNVRELEIRDSTGTETDGLMYQLRQDSDCRWLFVCHGGKPANCDIPKGDLLRFKLRGIWQITKYDTLSGSIDPLAVEYTDGWTRFRYPFYDHDSLLLQLTPGTAAAGTAVPKLADCSAEGLYRSFTPMPVTLDEPNVLLLDLAEYALDDAPYRPKEEILRIDNLLRTELGWPTRGEAFAQPWVEADESTPCTLRLRFTFLSELAVTGAELAMENAAMTTVYLNGIAARIGGNDARFGGNDAGPVRGWYVDKCIGKVPLPEITAGENILEISLPYGKKIDVEAFYLLGDFGVKVHGCQCTLTKPVRELAFGDITRQGLPFYGGNLTYHFEAALDQGEYELAATCYRGHLLRLAVDEWDLGVIAFAPYRLKTGPLTAGVHRFDLTLFGNRINTFGQLHQTDKATEWWGPDSWRSTGSNWTYEYNLWPQGVLKSPELFKAGKED